MNNNSKSISNKSNEISKKNSKDESKGDRSQLFEASNKDSNNRSNIKSLNSKNSGSLDQSKELSLNNISQSTKDYEYEKNLKIEELVKVFYHKLNLLKNTTTFTLLVKRLWDALEKNMKYEINKETFISVYRKMLLFILPAYNRKEINSFVNNEFLEFSHGNASMNIEAFTEAVFKLIHTWCTHINKYEYCYFLELIINRITKKIYTYIDGRSVTKIPNIKITIHKILSNKEDYEREIWDPSDADGEENEDPFYDYSGDSDLQFQRPNSNYYAENDFIIFDEDIIDEEEERERNRNIKINNDVEINITNNENERYYQENKESNNNEEVEVNNNKFNDEIEVENNGEKRVSSTTENDKPIFIKESLINDNEIVIFGYPTQYLLTQLRNNEKNSYQLDNNFRFKISNNIKIKENENTSQIDKITFYLELGPEINEEDLIDLVTTTREPLILSRNVFYFKNDASISEDFVEDELNVKNNLYYNPKLDRYLNFVEVDVYNLELAKRLEKEEQMNQLILNKSNMNHSTSLSMSMTGIDKEKVKIPLSERKWANIENLNISEIEQIALKNLLFKDKIEDPTKPKVENDNIVAKDKIGVFSKLWSETIEDKIKNIHETKFSIIYLKLLHFLNLPEDTHSVVKMLREEINSKKDHVRKDFITELSKFLNQFKSKENYYNESNYFNSDLDVIVEANRKSPVILLIGPPFIGKTAICKSLCQELNLVYVSPEDFVLNKLQKKILLWEEALENFVEEPDEEDDGENKDKEKINKPQKPKVKDFLTDLEYQVYFDLYMDSGEIKQTTLQLLYNYLVNGSEGFSRGVVIEHNYYRFDKEMKIISNNSIINDNKKEKEAISSFPKNQTFSDQLLSGSFGNIKLDYIVDLTLPEEEIKYRLQEIKYNLATGEKITKRDVDLIKNPYKPKKFYYPDEEIDEEEEAVDENNEDVDENLLPKQEDMLDILEFDDLNSNFNNFYLKEREKYIKFIEERKLDPSILEPAYLVHTDLSGLNMEGIVKLIKSSLMFTKYPRYIAKSLEGGSHKDLLIADKEGIQPFRRWSCWKDIDPVSLKDESLILHGNPEFAAEYCGRVFLFKNEENKNKFLENPKSFLLKPPSVPSKYRVAVFGPPKSGKKTIIKMLEEIYGLKYVNIEEVTNNVIEWQKEQEEHIPNCNFSSKVHFSNDEFKEITIKKKPVDFYSKVVFMLDHLGYPLAKKISKEEEKEQRDFNNNKLNHILFPPSRKRIKKKVEIEEMENEENEENDNEKNKNNSSKENNGENEEDENMNDKIKEEIIEPKEENYDDRLDRIINEIKGNDEEKQEEIEEWETDTQYIDPYPEEEEYTIPEVRSNQFYYAFDNNYAYPRPGGFVLLSQPKSEEEIAKFKEFNIVFDKIIYLVDESEEPLKALMQRNKPDFDKMDEEKQQNEINKMQDNIAKIEESITILREAYTVNEEDCIVKINIGENIETMKNKLKLSLNPFSLQPDDEEKCYNKDDFTNITEKINMPYGEYGKFCPVTYIQDNWLYIGPGEDELTVNHRRYIFAGKNEIDEFRKAPEKYLNLVKPVKIPPPKIMIISPLGGGATTIIKKLACDYKFTEVELKKEFLKIFERNFNERKEKRIQTKRELIIKEREEAKKAKQEENEGKDKNEINNEDEEPEPDIEELLKNDEGLNEENEEFNAIDSNKEIFKSLFKAHLPSIYDGDWFNMLEKVPNQFSELLFDTKRTPDVIVFLKTDLKNIITRNFDEKAIRERHKQLEIESRKKKDEQYQNLIEEKRKENEEKIKEAFNEKEDPTDEDKLKFKLDLENNKIKEIIIPQEEKDAIYEAVDENLIEIDLMLNDEKEKVIKRYEEDLNFINEFLDIIKRSVSVIEIDNNKNIELTYKNLYLRLNPYIRQRDNLIEKQLCNFIGENSTVEEPISHSITLRRLAELEQSHVVINGSMGKLSSVCPEKIIKQVNYPVVYRDKVYYFNDLEERNSFLETPLKYAYCSGFKLDKLYLKRDIIYVIGTLQTGKTVISDILEKRGYYHIKVDVIVKDLLEKLDNCELRRELETTLFTGKTIDDNLLIRSITRRLNMSDLVDKNIVFDGIPFTLSQVKNLEQNGFLPDLVIQMTCNDNDQFKRAFKQQDIFGYKDTVLEQIENTKFHSHMIFLHFFNKKFNIIKISSDNSNWYNETLVISYLEQRNKQWINMNINLNKNNACLVSKLISPYLKQKMLDSLEDFNFYSPVSIRNHMHFHYNKYNTDHLIFYNNNFYFLNDDKESDFFIKTPDLFWDYLNQVRFDIVPAKKIMYEKLAETIISEKVFEFQNCCPVTYLEKRKLIEGNKLNICEYKGRYYQMLDNICLRKFQNSPEKYIKQIIPVKMTSDEKSIEPMVVNFQNTINYLETNFGAIITKGMLELSKNRIKYPFIDVKETSIKYLALFLKSNNSKNNEYSKYKFNMKFKYFLKSSLLPFELLNIYENYLKAEDGSLKKKLLLREMEKLSIKYDELMEEAKNHKNTRFKDFF